MLEVTRVVEEQTQTSISDKGEICTKTKMTSFRISFGKLPLSSNRNSIDRLIKIAGKMYKLCIKATVFKVLLKHLGDLFDSL